MKVATGSRSTASWGKNFTTTLDPLPVHQDVGCGCLCAPRTETVQRLCVLPTVHAEAWRVQIPDIGRKHEHPAYGSRELDVYGGGHSLPAQQLRQRDYDALQARVQQLRLLLILLQLRPQQASSTDAGS